VEEAYHGLLMSGKHPVAIINLALSPREVDVNIHPTKTEVKFRNDQVVFRAIQKAVRQTLVEMAPVPRIEEVATMYKTSSAPAPIAWTPARSNVSQTSPLAPAPQIPALSLPMLRVVGQLSSSYIVAEGPDGLYLVDQHAAHERILFERIRGQQSRREIEVQALLEPVTFEVSPRQGEVLRAQCEHFADFGFSIEPFGERTFLIRAVPAPLASHDWPAVLRELLDTEGDKGDWEERITISIACHSAVRAGQVLSDSEMRELVRELELVTMPHTCPHGRPTTVHLSLGQLAREFGRS
jgi:DNA mismatch repair protein MutL